MQTVAQLIEALKAFPPDMRVIVDGYEGGFDDVEALQLQQIARRQDECLLRRARRRQVC